VVEGSIFLGKQNNVIDIPHQRPAEGRRHVAGRA
jgi:hypothetical protein